MMRCASQSIYASSTSGRFLPSVMQFSFFISLYDDEGLISSLDSEKPALLNTLVMQFLSTLSQAAEMKFRASRSFILAVEAFS